MVEESETGGLFGGYELPPCRPTSILPTRPILFLIEWRCSLLISPLPHTSTHPHNVPESTHRSMVLQCLTTGLDIKISHFELLIESVQLRKIQLHTHTHVLYMWFWKQIQRFMSWKNRKKFTHIDVKLLLKLPQSNLRNHLLLRVTFDTGVTFWTAVTSYLIDEIRNVIKIF